MANIAGSTTVHRRREIATAQEAGCPAILTEDLGCGAVRVNNRFGATGLPEAAGGLSRPA